MFSDFIKHYNIIRTILALGPYVKVLSPKRIIDEVVLRIKRAIELSEEGEFS